MRFSGTFDDVIIQPDGGTERNSGITTIRSPAGAAVALGDLDRA
ncbi:MAG: hypothetical protein ACLP8S_06330 [Solirubrobacteraceae bacterium]